LRVVLFDFDFVDRVVRRVAICVPFLRGPRQVPPAILRVMSPDAVNRCFLHPDLQSSTQRITSTGCRSAV
jgi:hypothetical protein